MNVKEFLKKYRNIKEHEFNVARQNYLFLEFTIDEVLEMLEAYHKSKVEAISDEMIDEAFKTQHFHYESGRYYKIKKDRIYGAKWFKEQLLKQ